VAVSPNGNFVYVTNYADSESSGCTLSVINTATDGSQASKTNPRVVGASMGTPQRPDPTPAGLSRLPAVVPLERAAHI
jgi:DNA-binding beta-propeller fold protein YncE